MSEFTNECWRCGVEFTEPVPRVFCAPCRPLAAAEWAERQVKDLTAFYLEHPDFPVPGDRVRRKTDDSRAFERAVMTDLADL